MADNRLNTISHVLVWIPGTTGFTWCRVLVIHEFEDGKYAVEFKDGSGIGYFPKDEVYSEPDLGMSEQVQGI